nr:MAG TPA: hypothetical protein [Caudoviricetes sp.]
MRSPALERSDIHTIEDSDSRAYRLPRFSLHPQVFPFRLSCRRLSHADQNFVRTWFFTLLVLEIDKTKKFLTFSHGLIKSFSYLCY